MLLGKRFPAANKVEPSRTIVAGQKLKVGPRAPQNATSTSSIVDSFRMLANGSLYFFQTFL